MTNIIRFLTNFFFLFKGASIGVIVGHVITLWITFGGLTITKPPAQLLPVDVSGCSNTSFNDHILKPEHRNFTWVPTTTPSPVNYTWHTERAESRYSFFLCFYISKALGIPYRPYVWNNIRQILNYSLHSLGAW